MRILNKDVLEGLDVVMDERNPYAVLFDLFRQEKISLFELRRRCKTVILKNSHKFAYEEELRKPDIHLTREEIEKGQYPEEYWEWVLKATKIKKQNHTNKRILQETIQWFKENLDRIEEVDWELLNRAEEVLKGYPEEQKPENKASDHIVWNVGELSRDLD